MLGRARGAVAQACRAAGAQGWRSTNVLARPPTHPLPCCPLALPQGSRHAFAAFFGAAGVGGRRRLHALLTRSSAGLRALLERQLGLGFEAPLMPQAAHGRAAAAAAQQQLDAGEDQVRARWALLGSRCG